MCVWGGGTEGKYPYTFQRRTSQGVLITEMLGVPRAAGLLICKYEESCKNTACRSRLNIRAQKYLRGTSPCMEARRKVSGYMCQFTPAARCSACLW